MSESKSIDLFEAPDELYEGEDQATLDAIDAGIRAVEEGRFVTSDEAWKLVQQWISELSTQNPR